MSGNVKCPIHGEHGNLSGGKCWYCVSTGNSAPAPKTSTVVGKKRKIA